MRLGNTRSSFGAVARLLHWAVALLILAAIPLGLAANRLPYSNDSEIARVFLLFSLHKTIGMTAFLLGLARIGWSLGQPRPVPLHPERRAETFLAVTVHWTLSIALVAVPLAGWISHAATPGLAPVLWPFGQTLPFLDDAPGVGKGAGTVHRIFAWTLIAAILLHVVGALKHALIDRDPTLARMTRGVSAGESASSAPVAAVFSGLGIWFLSLTAALTVALTAANEPVELAADWPIADGQVIVTRDGEDIAGTQAFGGQVALAPDAFRDEKGSLDLTIPLDALEGPGVDRLLADLPFAILQVYATVTGTPPRLAASGNLDLGGVTEGIALDVTLVGEGASIAGRAPLPGAPGYEITIDLKALRP